MLLLPLPLFQKIIQSSADDDTIAAGVLAFVLVVGRAAGAVIVTVATSRSTAVDLHAVTSAGDTVALTSAVGAGAVVAERRSRAG
jgi:hypothetical protein